MPRIIRKATPVARGIREGYRSGLEESVGAQLASLNVPFKYEDKEEIIVYVEPETKHKYHPDFVLPNGVIVETKGRFVTADRQKHLLIQKQHPDKDIRFVFSRSNTTISKSSKTTYADWCNKHGFKYADKLIPLEWIKELSK